MKTAALVFVLLILSVSGGEALRCNRCIPLSVGGSCSNTVETCDPGKDICGYVIFTYPRYSYFKRCMRSSEAFGLRTISGVQVFTCSTDLCN